MGNKTEYRSRLDEELVAGYDLCNGFDMSDLDIFYRTTCEAELKALKDDPEVMVYDTNIPGPADNPTLKIRVYKPADRTEEILPAVMWLHGGGFIFGSVYRQNDFCNRYAKNVGCAVVAVEYRLAPAHKAPAPVEDAYAALLYMSEHADELGIDPERIAIMGISAGGGICAALALMTRDRKGPQPVLQMPLYAELDYRMDTPSAKEITDWRVWSTLYSEISWKTYLDPEKPVDYYASPSLCEDVSGVAPVFSYVGTMDPLRDENVAYWSKLMAAGIPVEAHIYSGAFHTFEVAVPDASVSQKAYEAGYSALRKAFGIKE